MTNEQQIQKEFIEIFQKNKEQFYLIEKEYLNLLKIARIQDYIGTMRIVKGVNHNPIIDQVIKNNEEQNRKLKHTKELVNGTSILRY